MISNSAFGLVWYHSPRVNKLWYLMSPYVIIVYYNYTSQLWYRVLLRSATLNWYTYFISYKNILRIYWGSKWKILKNIEAQQKLRYSYKKKCVPYKCPQNVFKNIPEMCQEYIQNVPKIYPKCPKNHLKNIRVVNLRFHRYGCHFDAWKSV